MSNEPIDGDAAESVQLLQRFREGDEQAAAEIFDRYAQRLIALAASRISPALGRRVEAEDIVQSVYKSFFSRVSDDRLGVEEKGQLWGLLAAITVNKVRATARFHGAAKRDTGSEASVHSSNHSFRFSPEDFARTPSAVDAAIVEEQYSQIMGGLSEIAQTVFRMHLEDASVDEIAAEIRRSPRTVRRELEAIRKQLETLLVDL